jgi:AraC-like DNA-binding protein
VKILIIQDDVQEAMKMVETLRRAGYDVERPLVPADADTAIALVPRRLDQSPAPPDQRALLDRVQRFINDRLGDPGLTAELVAATHHVSLRSLQRLFQAHGTTVAGWIRDQRLDRCRRDLHDPGLAARAVSRIAARWGFSDPAHFSRVFKHAYGVSPARFRRSAR